MTDAAPRPVAPDSIDQPHEYQRFLVGLLADDDPADAQEASLGEFHRLIAVAADELRQRPEPSEWSVLECLAHIADAELVMAGRYRWAIAHDEPAIIGYDQDLWVQRLHGPDEDPAELVQTFSVLRRANLTLWRRLDRTQRERAYVHAERGRETVDLAFRMISGHDRFHLAQARWTLATVRGGTQGEEQ